MYPAKHERKTNKSIDKFIKEPLSFGEIKPSAQNVNENIAIKES